jgi:hypothetical protein
VELDAESYLARMILQYVLQLGTQHEEASAVAESALAMSGRHSWSMAILAIALADQGKPGDADAVYAEMLARARRRYMPPALLALAASAADREGNAIDHAREALAIRDPACQPFFSKYVPFNAKLRTYRRFQELLSEVGFE